jgi:glucan phosphoethanolaminetransferase (alkaline phosphatase superfamily)
MIQRVQSVYLFMITLLSSFLFTGSIVNFINKSGSVIKITFTSIVKSTEGQGLGVIEKLLPLSILIILIPMLSLITIFIFKNRKIQLRLAMSLIILCILLVIALIHGSIITISKFEAALTPGIKMTLPLVILILSVLAYRGIKKDDQLVKSYDRLR